MDEVCWKYEQLRYVSCFLDLQGDCNWGAYMYVDASRRIFCTH